MVGIEQEFEVMAHIGNNQSTARNFTVYSYVFDGGTLLSEGKVDEDWQGGWDANEIKLTLGANESEDIVLTNRVKSNADAGSYKLRVRIKDVKDLTRGIVVGEDEDAPAVRYGTCECDEGSEEGEEGEEGEEFEAWQNRTEAGDMLEGIRSAIGTAATDMVTGAGELLMVAVERVPTPDLTIVPRIVSTTWQGFIWAVEQIIRSW
jgi:hypothetical protein